jgi:hypothetical protein
MERAEELLRAGRVREGLKELERARKTLVERGDLAALRELAERAEATPDPRFGALAYAARQNVAYLERLGALGETPPRMTAGRMILIAAGIVAALAFYALVVYLQGV